MSAWKSHVFVAATLLAIASPAVTAQQAQGDFIATSFANSQSGSKGGLFLINGLGGSVKSLGATGDLLNSYAIATDTYDDSVVWVGTRRPSTAGAPAIFKVVTVAGKILSTTTLLSLTSADNAVYKLQVFGDQLLFLTATRLALIPRKGGKVQTLLTFSATTEQATNFAFDGRQLFLLMQPTRTVLAEHIYRHDFEDLKGRKLVYQAPGITYFLPSLSIDATGNLLVAEIEVFAGRGDLKQIDYTGKTLRTFRLPFKGGLAGVRADGDVIVVTGQRYDATLKKTVSGFITLLSWKVFKQEFGTSLERYTHLGLRRHEPLHRFGHVCRALSNWRAEIAASGQPRLGNSNYKLELSGRPGLATMLLVGVHGGLSTPVDLSGIGAGSCQLGVSALLSLGFRLDNAGKLTVNAPVPSTIALGNLDIQWLVADSTANRAGFVSSQVGTVAIRR